VRLFEAGTYTTNSSIGFSHLVKFGAIEIPRSEYLHLLNATVNLPRRFVE